MEKPAIGKNWKELERTVKAGKYKETGGKEIDPRIEYKTEGKKR